MKRGIWAASLALTLALSSVAGAVTVKGVDVPDTASVDGKALRLQGAGLRKKFGFSVYVGALYLTTPTTDAASAVRADEFKRISLRFLRDVGAGKLKETFEEGFFNNSQERLSALRPRIDAFLKLAAADVRSGEELALTYVPQIGTRVARGGRDLGVVPGRDFMEALWSIWLGDVPPAADLKKAMLGLAKP